MLFDKKDKENGKKPNVTQTASNGKFHQSDTQSRIENETKKSRDEKNRISVKAFEQKTQTYTYKELR